MTKRKLSLQQKRRIAEQRAQKKRENLPSDTSLGELQDGVVIANFGSQLHVENPTTKETQRCHVRANMVIVTGDRVGWRSGSETGVIEKRYDRDSELQRPDNYGKLRTVAANVSQMLITIAPEPAPFAGLIDRYLVAAKLHGLKVAIIINKVDCIGSDNKHELEEIERCYSGLGFPVIRASATSALENQQLNQVLKNETSIFVGQSGVGKSSLVKHLLPETEIRIGELSEVEKKGRHTTTHSQLYQFPFGGQCIDSPGIREFGLWHASPEQVLNGFEELAEKSQSCKFRDCAHKREPGCAIIGAVEQGLISQERFDSYQLIINQLGDVSIKPI